jgi:hypothetical protein
MNIWIRNMLVVLVSVPISSGSAAAQVNYEELYDQWHAALDRNLALNVPQWIDPPSVLVEVADVMNKINDAGFAMANTVCEKVADESNEALRLYRDILLLDRVTGINLLYGDKYEIDLSESIARNVDNFRKAWKAGTYTNVNPYIQNLCEDLTYKNRDDAISPHDIIAIRRYGLYGIPELIRQIKQNGSNHAFAAYLIMTGSSLEYNEYIVQPKRMYTSKAEKLAHMEKWLGTKKGQIANDCLGGKIENALRAQ